MLASSRILIVAVNWLGDLIFLTPAIRAIRQAYPKAFIACLVPPRGMELLSGNPHLDQVIPLDEKRGLLGWGRYPALVLALRRRRFDAAFIFHRSFTRALLMWASGIPHRIGYRTWKRGWFLTQAIAPAPSDSLHKAAYYLRLVEEAGLPSDGLRYDIVPTHEDERALVHLFAEWKVAPEDTLVALHAGANWRLKRWPGKRFALLADALHTRFGAKVVFVGDKEDLPLVESVMREMTTNPLLATGRTTFRELAALLKRTRLLISNDSGPLHLGVAVGTPVVALFGPTIPKLSGPPEEARAISLFGSIGCPVPCYQLRCPVNLCMEQISVEQVLEAARRFLR